MLQFEQKTQVKQKTQAVLEPVFFLYLKINL